MRAHATTNDGDEVQPINHPEARAYLERALGHPLTLHERLALWAARGRTRPHRLAEWLFAGLVLINVLALAWGAS